MPAIPLCTFHMRLMLATNTRVQTPISITSLLISLKPWNRVSLSLCVLIEMLILSQVPGSKGNFVFIKDAFYKKPDIMQLPFPTYFAPEDEDAAQLEAMVADLGEVDPFMAAD